LFMRLYKLALSVVLGISLVIFVVQTWHWPLVGDAPLIHYAVFLISHGAAPYRNIVDVNMPGAYGVEYLAMHVFGGGSLAWRLFDLFLGTMCAVAMVAISWPYDRLAGFLAGGLFILLHGRDGIIEMGQRDLTMAALLLAGYAFMFQVMRAEEPQRRLWCTALFGLCLGVAVTVKPTPMLLAPVLIALLCFDMWRKRALWHPHLLFACGAFLLPLLLVLLWLAHERAIPAFLTVVFRLIPAHADLHRRSFGYLTSHSFASVLIPPLLLWIPVALFGKFPLSRERWALLLGVVFGLASFYIQAKGFSYHRYPAEAFVLLLLCIDLCVCVNRTAPAGARWARPLGAAGLVVAVLVVGVGSVRKAVRYDWRNQQFDSMLRADLTALGGSNLNGEVQCLDTAAGCLSALYRMRLVQATGYLYDCYLLAPAADDQSYQEHFWDSIRSKPPVVFVVTSHLCGDGPPNYSYHRLHDWPQFDTWIAANYHLYADRIPSRKVYWSGEPAQPFGYRIYLRNGVVFPVPAHTSGSPQTIVAHSI